MDCGGVSTCLPCTTFLCRVLRISTWANEVPAVSTECDSRINRRFDFGKSRSQLGILRAGDRDSGELRGIPVDICRTSLKFKCDVPLYFQETLTLAFWSDSAELVFEVESEVRWIRYQEQDGAWVIGCRLAKEIPENIIAMLARSGDIDRRIKPRIATEVQAEGQFPGTWKRFPVTVLDYSESGVRLLTPFRLTANQRLMIRISPYRYWSVEVMSSVRWTAPGSEGFFAGCEILDGSRNAFEKCMKSIHRSSEEDGVQPKQRRLPLLISALVAIILMLLVDWCTKL